MKHLTNRIEALMSAQTPYMTDGGLETSLIFHYGHDLPCFAAFPLLDDAQGRAHLKQYYRSFFEIAQASGTGFVLDTALWRASTDWGAELGMDQAEVDRFNVAGATFARELQQEWQTADTPVVVNGVIGPRGDGYVIDSAMTSAEATEFHRAQVRALAEGGVEMITAVTMTYTAEAIGVARAAIAQGVPVVVSFTVETDGHLPSGQSLKDAIEEVDAATDGEVLYFMINCAHPDHYSARVTGDAAWRYRIGGLRSNASRMSHEELDNAEELDAGNPEEFGLLHKALTVDLPNIRVLGGCCGTDNRHIGCMAHGHKHVA